MKDAVLLFSCVAVNGCMKYTALPCALCTRSEEDRPCGIQTMRTLRSNRIAANRCCCPAQVRRDHCGNGLEEVKRKGCSGHEDEVSYRHAGGGGGGPQGECGYPRYSSRHLFHIRSQKSDRQTDRADGASGRLTVHTNAAPQEREPIHAEACECRTLFSCVWRPLEWCREVQDGGGGREGPGKLKAGAVSVGEWQNLPFSVGECGELICTKGPAGDSLRPPRKWGEWDSEKWVFCHFSPSFVPFSSTTSRHRPVHRPMARRQHITNCRS